MSERSQKMPQLTSGVPGYAAAIPFLVAKNPMLTMPLHASTHVKALNCMMLRCDSSSLQHAALAGQ